MVNKYYEDFSKRAPISFYEVKNKQGTYAATQIAGQCNYAYLLYSKGDGSNMNKITTIVLSSIHTFHKQGNFEDAYVHAGVIFYNTTLNEQLWMLRYMEKNKLIDKPQIEQYSIF